MGTCERKRERGGKRERETEREREREEMDKCEKLTRIEKERGSVRDDERERPARERERERERGGGREMNKYKHCCEVVNSLEGQRSSLVAIHRLLN